MVKNRFKSLYRSQCKRNHIVGESNDDIIIQKIKEQINLTLSRLRESKNVEISKKNSIQPKTDEKNSQLFFLKDESKPKKLKVHHFIEEYEE